ncbi:unnamed protein product [Meganyctiphanes norvegica]|uniref:Uncharacterized protein n=2 Tax=Meganyctiphanes norvegica TaxID=48144 RepID=A0AAV2RKW6_MEGNR
MDSATNPTLTLTQLGEVNSPLECDISKPSHPIPYRSIMMDEVSNDSAFYTNTSVSDINETHGIMNDNTLTSLETDTSVEFQQISFDIPEVDLQTSGDIESSQVFYSQLLKISEDSALQKNEDFKCEKLFQNFAQKEQIEKLETALFDSNTKCIKLESMLSTKLSNIEELNARLDDTLETLEETHENAKQLKKQVSYLENKVEIVQNKLTEKCITEQNLVKESEEMKKKLQNLEETEKENDAITVNSFKLRDEISKMEYDLWEVKKTLATRTSKTQKYIGHLKREHHEDLENLQYNLDSLDYEYGYLENDFYDLENSYYNDNHFLNNRIIFLEQSCNNISQKLQGEINNSRTKESDLLQKLQQSERQLKEAEKSNNLQSVGYNEFRNALSKYKNEIELLKKQLVREHQQKSSILNKLSEAEDQLKSSEICQGKCSSNSVPNEETKKQIVSMQQHIDKLKKKMNF